MVKLSIYTTQQKNFKSNMLIKGLKTTSQKYSLNSVKINQRESLHVEC